MSTLSLAEVRWRSRRNPAGGPPLVHVSFLRGPEERETAAAIGGIAGYFESLVGRPRRAYDPDVPVTIAGERRLGRGLAAAYQDWYRWTALRFDEALPANVAGALARAGVETPSALRLRLFDLVNERYPGFVPAALRTEALTALAASLGLAADAVEHLDRALVLDAEEEAVLVREGTASVAEVMASYNRAVLAALLRQATRVSVTLHAPEGGLIRRLYAHCRRLGVYCEIEHAATPRAVPGSWFLVPGSPQQPGTRNQEPGTRNPEPGTGAVDAFQVTIAGPDAVVGPPAAAGPRLARAVLSLLRRLGPADQASADLVLRERPYRLQLDSALLRLPGLGNAAEEADVPGDDAPRAVGEDAGAYEATAAAFDSEVEARLAREFAALRRQGRAAGWRLVREPAPLLAGRRVLLPDFALVRGEARVFVEVAGFWTPGYLTKKRQALEQLPPETPLLLAVAPPAAEALAGLPFPAVPYRDAVPVARLLALAEMHYGDFGGRTAGAGERLRAACAAAAGGRLSEEDLAALLGCHSPGEVSRILMATPLPSGWLRVPGAGLCGPDLCDAIEAALTEAWTAGGEARLDLPALRALLSGAALPEGDEALAALLEQLSACRVVRGSLFAVEIHPPDDESPGGDAGRADEPTIADGRDQTGVQGRGATRATGRKRSTATRSGAQRLF